MKPRIRLSPDYHCWPLWWVGGDLVGDIDPHSLPLRPETIARLEQWAETFESGFNWEDPASSTWPSHETIDAFEREGIDLWLTLREELKDTHEVFYTSQRDGAIFTHPDELPNLD